MRSYDPTFDLYDFHQEAREIFIDFFNNFLHGDLEYLENFISGQALAIVKTELKLRKEG